MLETNDTVPNSPEQPDQPVPPAPTFPAKFIQRALIGHGSNLRMQVDGREIETTLLNASIELQLTAGKHVVHVSATADFLKSKEHPIEVFPHGDNTWVVDHTWPYNRYRVVPHERWLDNKYTGFFVVPRLHLSTAFLCMILAGVLVGLNTRPPFEPLDISGVGGWLYVDVAGRKWGCLFQFCAESSRNTNFSGRFGKGFRNASEPETGTFIRWDPNGGQWDFVLGVAILATAGWYLERRERKRAR